MLIINNIPILASVRDIMYDIRSELIIKGISVFSNMKSTSSDIMTNCIFHIDSKPSFGVMLHQKKTKDKILHEGHFHCFSCGKSGSIEELVSHCFGYDDRGKFGTEWLIDRYSNFELDNRESVFILPSRKHKSETIQQFIEEDELITYRRYHDYMYKRGLTEDIINKFDIGYQKNTQITKTSTPFESITFPVRDIKGNCIFVAKRSIKSKLFLLPKDIEKPLYGIYELQYLFPQSRELYICESVFNALTLIRFGLPAIALFGTGAENQIELLKSLPYRTFYLCLDGDKAGNNGIYRLTRGLKDDKILYRVETPSDGTDINDHWQEGVTWFKSLQKYIL